MPIRPYEGKFPIIGDGVYLDDTALVIGRVTLANDVSLWPYVVVRGDVNTISIGARCNIQDHSVLHVTHDGPYTPGGFPLVIGKDVTVGHKCLLHGCSIGDFCLVGMGSIVMDGVVIEPEVLVAAGSLVSPGKLLESGYLYRGNPAMKVRNLTVKEIEMLHYSAEHYLELKNRHMYK
jgi:carbonic anhydrase/acetyltransferase-like protein (isoleucine patch superfamily)